MLKLTAYGKKEYESPDFSLQTFAVQDILSASNDNFVTGEGGADKDWGDLL